MYLLSTHGIREFSLDGRTKMLEDVLFTFLSLQDLDGRRC